MAIENKTGNAEFKKELSQLIRARYPLLYLQTFEEVRAINYLTELCKERSSHLYVWSRTEGITRDRKSVAGLVDPAAPLKWYEELNEKSVLVLKDYHPY